MQLVYIFCSCLVLGLVFSQTFDLSEWRYLFTFFTNTFLAYIMIEVGLEFVLNKKKWKSYLKDYLVAMVAAALPWIFCFLYFIWLFKDNSWEELLLVSRFAAPTSSGILFSMLAAAGLAMTWLFKKVEILAILDDVDTMLLLIPLQFLLGGTRWALLSVAFFIVILVILAWKFLHQIRLPSGRIWLFVYGFLLAISLRWIAHQINVELEILLPAFVLGCMLYNPHDPRITGPKAYYHEHAFIEPEEKPLRLFDRTIKMLFMFLVGLLLPKIAFSTLNICMLVFHVSLITLLSNLGKCFPIFCYKNEASIKERIAVGIGMFPRGEVGAGILVLAIDHGITGYPITVSVLSLALNLLLTGVFISIVIRLVKKNVPNEL